MKLNKKDESRLNGILADLKRGQKHLLNDNTLIGMVTTISAMPSDTWVNKETGKTAIQTSKHVGTELCYIANAISNLERFLNPVEVCK